jgi:hypothetical protein
MKTSLKKTPTDLSQPENLETYVHDTHNRIDLLHKEIDINHAEQELILERIQLMTSFVNDLPSSDPQYSMLRAQIQMDQVELDEMKRREQTISEQLKTLSKKEKQSSNK